MVLITYLQGSNGNTDIKNILNDPGDGKNERLRCAERVTWKFTLPYIK